MINLNHFQLNYYLIQFFQLNLKFHLLKGFFLKRKSKILKNFKMISNIYFEKKNFDISKLFWIEIKSLKINIKQILLKYNWFYWKQQKKGNSKIKNKIFRKSGKWNQYIIHSNRIQYNQNMKIRNLIAFDLIQKIK